MVPFNNSVQHSSESPSQSSLSSKQMKSLHIGKGLNFFFVRINKFEEFKNSLYAKNELSEREIREALTLVIAV